MIGVYIFQLFNDLTDLGFTQSRLIWAWGSGDHSRDLFGYFCLHQLDQGSVNAIRWWSRIYTHGSYVKMCLGSFRFGMK